MTKGERINLGDEILRDNYYESITLRHEQGEEYACILKDKDTGELIFLSPKEEKQVKNLYLTSRYVSNSGLSWSRTYIYSTVYYKAITPIHIRTDVSWYRVFLNQSNFVYLYSYRDNFYKFVKLEEDKIYRYRNQYIIPEELNSYIYRNKKTKGKIIKDNNLILYHDGEKYLIGKNRISSVGKFFQVLHTNIQEYTFPTNIVGKVEDILGDKEFLEFCEVINLDISIPSLIC